MVFGEKESTKDNSLLGKDSNIRIKIARRAAQEVKNGMNVNLGIGIPTLLPTVLPADVKINLQSENGIIGVGPYPSLSNVLANNINAGKVRCCLVSKLSRRYQEDPTSHLHNPSQSSVEGTLMSPCWELWKLARRAISPIGSYRTR